MCRMNNCDDAQMNTEKTDEEFWELVSRYHNDLYRFALALTGVTEDAEDTVGEAVLAAFRAFETLRDVSSFKSFLFTICSRVHKRRLWRGSRFTPLNDSADETIAATNATPEMAADARFLYDALARLPRKLREAVALFELSDCSLREISEIQGASLSAVKARVVRGRRKLAVLLGADDAEALEKNAPSGDSATPASHAYRFIPKGKLQ